MTVEEMYVAYRPWLVRSIGFRYEVLRDEAEDIIQETFIKAQKFQYSFNGRASEKTWLWAIARRTAIQFFRSHRGFRSTQSLWEERDGRTVQKEISDKYTSMNQMQQALLISYVLRFAKPKERRLFIAFLAGMSPEVMAAKFGMSEESARNKFTYGVRRARAFLGKYIPEQRIKH